MIRVTLVMGGGTSLGAFSGGALSQCLSDLDLLAKTGIDIKIDVVAGASAGSLTLALALHSLCSGEPAAALELVHKKLKQAWVDDITMKDLVTPTKGKDLRYLLNRDVVDRIAREKMKWTDGTAPRPHPLLAPRVLFTCSMANVAGIGVDARDTIQGVKIIGRGGLADPLTATYHKDPRIFDLRFTANLPALKPTFRVLDLAQNSSWLEIAGSAVASGAFPFAFEPVPLLRYPHEYPSELKQKWPKYHGPGGDPESDDAPTLRCYSDGGLMDNEPLEQALEHCRLLDFEGDAKLGDNDERVILYIDPFADGHIPPERLSLDDAVSRKRANHKVVVSEIDVLGQVWREVGAVVNMLRKQCLGRAWIQNPDSVLAPYTNKLTLIGISPHKPEGGMVSFAGKEVGGFKGFLDRTYRDYDWTWGEHLGGAWMRQWKLALPQAVPVPPDETIHLKPPENFDDFDCLLRRIEELGAGIDLGLLEALPLTLLRAAAPLKLRDLVTEAFRRTSPERSPEDIPCELCITKIPKAGANRSCQLTIDASKDKSAEALAPRYSLPAQALKPATVLYAPSPDHKDSWKCPHADVEAGEVVFRISLKYYPSSESNEETDYGTKAFRASEAEINAAYRAARNMVSGEVRITLDWGKAKVLSVKAEEALIPWPEQQPPV